MGSDLSKIEETLAHQEQQINDLSDMVITQSKEIAALQKELLKLQGKIEDLSEDAPAADQKPPHY